VREVIAVAGTATSCASIDLGLDPYDPAKTEGHVLTTGTLAALLDQLAALPLAERKQVTGLHPDRAPTIVAGVAILLEVLDAFAAQEATVSDRDILWGVALSTASAP
jgi:exopolyphosphatase/guanosine-5'-triphosphate,3'-diphosphate pyrophosphatase